MLKVWSTVGKFNIQLYTNVSKTSCILSTHRMFLHTNWKASDQVFKTSSRCPLSYSQSCAEGNHPALLRSIITCCTHWIGWYNTVNLLHEISPQWLCREYTFSPQIVQLAGNIFLLSPCLRKGKRLLPLADMIEPLKSCNIIIILPALVYFSRFHLTSITATERDVLVPFQPYPGLLPCFIPIPSFDNTIDHGPYCRSLQIVWTWWTSYNVPCQNASTAFTLSAVILSES